jgi:tripartite-type tricarboxylate transporter receptor subunit TctC
MATLAPAAMAQAWPAHPLRLIVPFPPGGPTDIVGRLVAQKLSDGLGQQVVVDNRVGAGGTVGSEAAARSPADGYTLLYGSTSTLGIAPGIYPKLGYDPRTSFAPVSLVSIGPLVLAVHPSVPARNVRELIDLARARPGKLNFASAGSGTPLHLAGELFRMITDTDMVHVPYKGGGPAVADLLAGQVQLVFESFANLGPHIRAGKLRALLVTARERNPQYPDVPSITDAGLPQFEISFWSGLVAPAGTPPEVIARLNAEVRKALATPEARNTLAAQGLEPRADSPAEFAAFIAREVEQWGRAIKASGARAD